ncbi:MAG: hypothetical protein ACPGVO_20150 [Spirulinaceae cyanobacterium]
MICNEIQAQAQERCHCAEANKASVPEVSGGDRQYHHISSKSPLFY